MFDIGLVTAVDGAAYFVKMFHFVATLVAIFEGAYTTTASLTVYYLMLSVETN